MAEVGIDIAREFPKPWTDEIVRAADVVVTMGCGDACPLFPGKRYEDWELDDPAGQGVDAVRPIRDEIGRRVRALLAELGATDRRLSQRASVDLGASALDGDDVAPHIVELADPAAYAHHPECQRARARQGWRRSPGTRRTGWSRCRRPRSTR